MLWKLNVKFRNKIKYKQHVKNNRNRDRHRHIVVDKLSHFDVYKQKCREDDLYLIFRILFLKQKP